MAEAACPPPSPFVVFVVITLGPWSGPLYCYSDEMRSEMYAVALRIPFGFAHFNDGEIIAARSSEGRTDRGQQQLSPGLRASMQVRK